MYLCTTPVKLYISPEVPAEWKTAINQAVISWNNVNSSVKITVVTDLAGATTKVIGVNEGSSTNSVAYAYLPHTGGKAGTLISINTYYNYYSVIKKTKVMIHELGHIVGLEHTDQDYGFLIPCTPINDIASVMQSMAEDNSFTTYDIIAISTLFPLVPGAKKLYRYKKNQYYFYTTNACDIISGKDGYVFDKDAGYVYSTQISGTVPLYRSLNGVVVKDHKLSGVQKSSDDVILGYIYATQQPNTTPLYSMISSYEYSPTNYMHYLYSTTYSIDQSLGKVIAGYVLTN